MPSPVERASPLLTNWLQSLQSHASHNLQDDPNYYVSNPQSLITESIPIRYSVGNGHQVLSSIIPACQETQHELIIVTCFWAKSTSRDAISNLLRTLSDKGLSQDRKIQVRLCFSSCSPWQKLFQTASLNGKIYPSSSWVKLGLPHPRELKGLDLVIKSIFVRPFSVMHPKFILVDRQRAFMPSCNVSWESWFEGCIEMQGEGICSQLYTFWDNFWSRSSPPLDETWRKDFVPRLPVLPPTPELDLIGHRNFNQRKSIPTVLLPSPHHMNPRFSPFSRSNPPPTPLNAFLLEAINSATSSIYMQTPNLTCRAVRCALVAALQRGISITIITSSKLMILEQLVTAFTITEFAVWKLKRKYNKLLLQHSRFDESNDLEEQRSAPGSLKIGYYHPRSIGEEGTEPVKSHLKLTVVDEEVVVLGSGNMDRASWYTSQELGIALLDRDLAREVLDCTGGALTDRVSHIFQR